MQPFQDYLQPDFINTQMYDISLSSMWAINNFGSLEDSFALAQQMGFIGIELNHQLSSAMLKGIDFSQYQVRSVHEPCPADIPAPVLTNNDWLVSALDEESRKKGILAVQRSIDLAQQLGASLVVVHCGTVKGNFPANKELHAVYLQHGTSSEAFQMLKSVMLKERAENGGRRLQAVKNSLSELIDYASRYSIRLGLENRYHFPDIPSPDEMEELLGLAGPEQLGVVYDTGHGQALDALGFYSHYTWLDRFKDRIVGVHLHDVQGIRDHLSPGTGTVNFEEIAKALPVNALRTMEIRSDQTPIQVVAGLKTLAEKGCVQCL